MDRVNIVTPKFLSFDGVSCPYGGGERYIVDLCKLLKSNGLDPYIYQLATCSFKKNFKDIPVVGVKTNLMISVHFPRLVLDPVISTMESCQSFDKIIYFNMQCWPIGGYKKGIAISHGVYWDRLASQEHTNIAWRQIGEAIDNNFLVSVDANTVNVIQSRFPTYQRSNSEIIPNYVDLNLFNPTVRSNKPGLPFTVLFPRRLTFPRGYELAVFAADEILGSTDEYRFIFAGSGLPGDIVKIDKLKAKHGQERCLHVVYPSDESYNMFEEADISIIPTIHSEGTSLSALESMACRVPVIGTRVGGLAEIIIPEFTAFETKPTGKDLIDAIYKLDDLMDRDLEMLQSVLDNAASLARTFSKDRWEQKWTDVLAKVGWI